MTLIMATRFKIVPNGSLVRIKNFPTLGHIWFGLILKLNKYDSDSLYHISLYSSKEMGLNESSGLFRESEFNIIDPNDSEYINFMEMLETEEVVNS